MDTLLNVDDFGGIETWQGGPAYVYNNISGNPGGYRNWDQVLSPETEDRFGHAYYLDGAFKNYYFNNIAWGRSKGPSGRLANTSAFQAIISYQNTIFNNTLYNFMRRSRRQAPQAGRVKFLGNIWQSMGLRVFRDADPAKTAADGREAHARIDRGRFAIDTNAYPHNVFYDVGESFGVFEPSGRWHSTLASFRNALESYKPLAASVGVMAERSPLQDPGATISDPLCCLPRHSGFYRASSRHSTYRRLERLSSGRLRHDHLDMSHSTRTRKQYDHRLRQRIQSTGDLGLAVRYGVRCSTARGWLKQSRTDVFSIHVLDLDAVALPQELLTLRRRLARLTCLLPLFVVALSPR